MVCACVALILLSIGTFSCAERRLLASVNDVLHVLGKVEHWFQLMRQVYQQGACAQAAVLDDRAPF